MLNTGATHNNFFLVTPLCNFIPPTMNAIKIILYYFSLCQYQKKFIYVFIGHLSTISVLIVQFLDFPQLAPHRIAPPFNTKDTSEKRKTKSRQTTAFLVVIIAKNSVDASVARLAKRFG